MPAMEPGARGLGAPGSGGSRLSAAEIATPPSLPAIVPLLPGVAVPVKCFLPPLTQFTSPVSTREPFASRRFEVPFSTEDRIAPATASGNTARPADRLGVNPQARVPRFGEEQRPIADGRAPHHSLARVAYRRYLRLVRAIREAVSVGL